MKKRHTEEQILGILREAEQGKPVADVLREQGIAAPTYYRWKSKYSGMEPNQLRQLRELERENSQLKRIVADCPSTVLSLGADLIFSTRFTRVRAGLVNCPK